LGRLGGGRQTIAIYAIAALGVDGRKWGVSAFAGCARFGETDFA
jgi:hypothetical protein